MAERRRQFICRSHALTDSGRGRRFRVSRSGNVEAAFVIRYRGRVHAYLNRCAHRSLELDWNAGEFFDRAGEYLLCATHGARYAPDSGRCRGGPCGGGALIALPVMEESGEVLLDATDEVHLVIID